MRTQASRTTGKSASLVFSPVRKDYRVVGASLHFHARHIVDGIMACCIALALVLQQIAQIDPAMRANHVKWDFAVLDEPNEKRTRDAENVCRSLGCELLMLGYD